MTAPGHELLRPPIEFGSAVSCFSLAALAIAAPQVLFLPGGVGYAIGGGLILRGLFRTNYGLRILRYQRGLRLLPEYAISPKEISASRTDLFLGMGFEWRTKHSQRRADLLLEENEEYTHDSATYEAVRGIIDGVERNVGSWAVWVFNRPWLFNPFPPYPYVEGDATLHAVGLWEKERAVAMKQAERVAHHIVLGTTRVGKTRFLEVLATQDIHNGDIVIVIDPKGDGDLLARLYVEAERAGRLGDLQIFHLGFPEHSARYNPIGDFGRVTEIAGRVTGSLPAEGNSAAFREFAWRYVNVIAKALTQLGKRMNYETLLHYGNRIDPLLIEYLSHILDEHRVHGWSDRVEALVLSDTKMPRELADRDRNAWAIMEIFLAADIPDSTAGSLIKTFQYPKSFYEKLVASLFPLLEKLTTGSTAALLSPDYFDLNDQRPIFDWMSVIRSRGIVYIGLDALTDADVAAAVGNAMFADLTSVAGQLYKHSSEHGLPELPSQSRKRGKKQPKLCIHADEFNELIGKEFIPLANKAGGAGFQLTVYTQTLSDILVPFGNLTARAGQVIGNLGTTTMLRTKEPATAELVINRLRKVQIKETMIESGASDSSNPDTDVDFVSNTRQRTTRQWSEMLQVDDLEKLPKGHAFTLTGGRLYKVRLPLFTDEADLPQHISEMTSNMKRRYSSDEQWNELMPIAWGDA